MIFRIEVHEHGAVVYGGVPIDHFAAITAFGNAAGWDQIAFGLAHPLSTLSGTFALGERASMVLASKKSCKVWAQELEAVAAREQYELLSWWRGTEVGESSKVIAAVLNTGPGVVPLPPSAPPPRDAADYERCAKLVKRMDWRSRLPELATRFPHWAPHVERWDNWSPVP